MNAAVARSYDDLNDSILSSQYDDLIRRRRSALDGEYKLLWAILGEAIKNYLANMECSTSNQRAAFAEVRRWFRPAKDKLQGLFTFQTICELLGVNPDLLLRRLESVRVNDLPKRRCRRDSRTNTFGHLAA
jgi:hypothetical protein